MKLKYMSRKKKKIDEVAEEPKEVAEESKKESVEEDLLKQNPKTTPPYPIEASAMKDDEMNSLLVELASTNYWQAIKRFVAIQSIIAENSLCSLDPFKEPTKMAQNQGIRIGLIALDNKVNMEIQRRKDMKAAQDKPKVQYGGMGYGYT